LSWLCCILIWVLLHGLVGSDVIAASGTLLLVLCVCVFWTVDWVSYLCLILAPPLPSSCYPWVALVAYCLLLVHVALVDLFHWTCIVGYFAGICGLTVLEVIWAFEKWLIGL
jgi:hypothetical protein